MGVKIGREKKTLGVVSGKGGVGKSTVAINLAYLYTESKVESLLIDGDIFNPSIALHLGMWHHTLGLQDVLTGKAEISEAIVAHPGSGVRVLPSALKYDRRVGMEDLKDSLKGVETYDLILIDSPPGLSSDVEGIIRACTDAVVITTPDVPSATSAVKMLSLCQENNVRVGGVVVNRVRDKKYELHRREIESMCDARVLCMIPEDESVPASIAMKAPVTQCSPNSTVSESLRELAAELYNAPIRRAPMPWNFFWWLREIFRRFF
ncbi:MAG: P-loop NTPase [Candidatus Micrarchaeota archaeon]